MDGYKDSTLKSILNCNCPKCHQGKMFVKGKLSKPSSLFSMNKRCENCHQSFEPEPGFYFGAMFISYAINTALFITVWILLKTFYPDYSLTMLLITISLAAILALPIIFRLSRSIWIAIFIPFKQKSEPSRDQSAA